MGNILHSSCFPIDSIKEFYSNYLDFISNLSFEQKIILFNTIESFLLLYIFISLIVINYLDKLINYYNIESRFPRLSSILYYRSKKYNKYYFICNVIGIIITLFIMISINLIILFL